MVLNKADQADPQVIAELGERYQAHAVSAIEGDGLDELRRELASRLSTGHGSPLPVTEPALTTRA